MPIGDVKWTADVQEVRRLYGDRVYRPVFDYFSRRVNASKQTTVDALLAALKKEAACEIPRQELIKLLKSLQKANCGVFRAGRKRHPSRFEWGVDLVSVGKAAGGDVSSVEAMTEVEPRVTQESDNDEIIVEHPFALRPGFKIVLSLPQSLTAVEANRVADFVRALPFER